MGLSDDFLAKSLRSAMMYCHKQVNIKKLEYSQKKQE